MAARFLTLRGTGTKIQEKGLISHQKFTFKSTRHLHAGGRISTQYFLYTIPNKDSETVRYQKWARKKWADMFCVLWLEQGIFVCNTFKKFVQYKIGFMVFFSFVITTEWQDWRSEKREHWDLFLGPRTELPFVLPMGLQRRWFICWL